jgi:hypothetical protein
MSPAFDGLDPVTCRSGNGCTSASRLQDPCPVVSISPMGKVWRVAGLGGDPAGTLSFRVLEVGSTASGPLRDASMICGTVFVQSGGTNQPHRLRTESDRISCDELCACSLPESLLR